ncbi:MAG: DUF4293 family protein [Sphingobacteriaceae bacterium]|nr:DUF4293 family protein [Sphingobacteriaceae bacterium]
MIQRIQSLFLIEIIFLCVSLFFVPVQHISNNGLVHPITLVPNSSIDLQPGEGLYGILGLNILTVIISGITLFMFKKRELQIKLCYLLVILFVIMICIISFYPLTEINQNMTVSDNIFAYVILIVASISAYLAAHFIKKDVELIKSSDRIR